jgi:Tfp pilus assembly protein PilE
MPQAKRKKQAGFTTAELLTLIIFFSILAAAIGSAYVAIHFLTKFW